MTMLSEFQFTEARNDFSNLYNEVYNALKPVIVRRKQKEQVLLMRIDLQKVLLEEFKLKPKKLTENDGSITLALDEIELYVNADTTEKAVEELIQDIKNYAQDYIQRPQLFLNAPNRRSHFPYILRVLLCDNDDEIKSLLEV
jgi:PHD/YefM family antitoxin component YafN of YafNO toxin-antitoxin module